MTRLDFVSRRMKVHRQSVTHDWLTAGCMECKTSLEANSRSSGQEIHRLLSVPKNHYLIHLSQINLISNISPYFFKINFNIILFSAHTSIMEETDLSKAFYLLSIYCCTQFYASASNDADVTPTSVHTASMLVLLIVGT
jgi:hypothetical protein